ncbi:hypothetical protein [Streptomyces mirabilis]
MTAIDTCGRSAIRQRLRVHDSAHLLAGVPRGLADVLLLGFAQEQQPAVTPDFLDIKGAITAAHNDLPEARDTEDREQLEQRHDEIRALLHLLHKPATGPAAAHTGTLTTI